jgi:hypothetical protein
MGLGAVTTISGSTVWAKAAEPSAGQTRRQDVSARRIDQPHGT